MESFLESGMHWQVLNFGLFLGLLAIFLRRPVMEFWKTRSHAIAFEMEEAERQRREAGKKVFDLEMRVDRLEREIEELVGSFKEEGELEKRKILEEMESRTAKLKRDAERIREQEVRKVQEALKREAVQISLESAERLLKEQFSSADQQRLKGRFLKEVESRL